MTRKDALLDGILIAATALLFAFLLTFQSACEKDKPDPILGFWKDPNTDEAKGWAFYSDGRFARYVDLCNDELRFAGTYERTADGLVLDDGMVWHVEFQTRDFCRVRVGSNEFVMQRQFWGQ